MDFALIINLLINSSVMASLLVIITLIIKSLLKNRLRAQLNYIIWFILLIRLAVPYIGLSPLNISDLFTDFKITSNDNSETKVNSVKGGYNDTTHLQNRQQEKRTNPGSLIGNYIRRFYLIINNIRIDYKSIFLVWILGVCILGLYSFLYNILFWNRIKNGTVFLDQNIIGVLEKCKEEMGVHTNVSIIQTAGISIPAIFGVTRPWLLMPEKVLKILDDEKIRYVILHELAHLKRKDIIINWIAYILQIIHWFNPLIWYAFHKMRADRESACDETVLMHLGKGEVNKYGHTILDMVEIVTRRMNYAGVAGILENKSQIKDRITMISRFGSRSKYSFTAVIILLFLGSSIMINAANFTGNISNTEGVSTKDKINISTDTSINQSAGKSVETSNSEKAVSTVISESRQSETIQSTMHDKSSDNSDNSDKTKADSKSVTTQEKGNEGKLSGPDNGEEVMVDDDFTDQSEETEQDKSIQNEKTEKSQSGNDASEEVIDVSTYQ